MSANLFKFTPRIAVALAFLINGLMHGAIATRLPQFMIQADLNKAQVGLMLFAFAAAAVCGFPLAGVLISRIGSRRVTVLTTWGSLAAFVLLSFAFNIWTAMLFAGALGFFHGGMDVAMNQQGVEVEDALTKKVLASFHAVWTVGAVISAGLAFGANRLDMSLTQHYVILAIALVPLVLITLPRLLASGNRPEPKPLLVFPPKALLGLAIIGLFLTAAEGALFEWSTLWVVEIAGSAVDWAVAGSLSFLTAMVIARLMLDRAISHLDPVLLMASACTIAGAGMAVAVTIGTLPWALAALFLCGLGVAGTFPILLGIAAREKTLAPGMGAATMTLFLYGGSLTGAPVMGFVAEASSVHTSMGLTAAILLTVGGFAIFTSLKARSHG